jgi:hypothetical protein
VNLIMKATALEPIRKRARAKQPVDGALVASPKGDPTTALGQKVGQREPPCTGPEYRECG